MSATIANNDNLKPLMEKKSKWFYNELKFMVFFNISPSILS